MESEEYAPLALATEAPHPEMSEKKIRLVHAALGLTSETTELIEAWNAIYKATTLQERKAIMLNIAEEIGDALWFHNLGCKALSHLMPLDDVPQGAPGDNPMHYLAYKTGVFADLVKAHVFYNKPNEFDMRRVLARIQDALTWLAAHLQHDGFGVGTIPQLRAKNIAKLKARYPGKYSEAAALNRDKEAEYAAIAKA